MDLPLAPLAAYGSVFLATNALFFVLLANAGPYLSYFVALGHAFLLFTAIMVRRSPFTLLFKYLLVAGNTALFMSLLMPSISWGDPEFFARGHPHGYGPLGFIMLLPIWCAFVTVIVSLILRVSLVGIAVSIFNGVVTGIGSGILNVLALVATQRR